MSAETDGFWNMFESVGSDEDELQMKANWERFGITTGADEVEIVGSESPAVGEMQLREFLTKVSLPRNFEDF